MSIFLNFSQNEANDSAFRTTLLSAQRSQFKISRSESYFISDHDDCEASRCFPAMVYNSDRVADRLLDLAIHAFSSFNARCFVMDAHRVERGDLTQPFHRIIQRIYHFVYAGDHDHLARSIADRRNPVAGRVNIDQLALPGDRIGTGQEHIRQ